MSQVTHSGLEAWVSRVRNELASATGMAEFTERVQTRGFDWMANFVDSVLHDETIVEIAKTPGRQKSAKKTRSRAVAIAASAAKLRTINSETCDALAGKENALASPTRGSARKMQRALLAARENGDSDEENYNRPGTVAPIKSLAFDVSSRPEGPRCTPKSKSKSGSPTRLPKSLLRSPNKPHAAASREPEKENSRLDDLPTPHSPSPNHSKPDALSERNPFLSLPQPSRTPLAVLEEHSDEAPNFKTVGGKTSPWKPDPPINTPLPAPSPSRKTTDLCSPMKVDGPLFEEPSAGFLHSVPLDSAAKPPASPHLFQVQPIPEEGTEHKSRQQPPPPPSPTPLPESAVSLDARSEGPSQAARSGDSPAPPVNTHIDVVVPLNGGDGTSRPSLFKAANQAARQSGGAGLRRSTFARSFAPRSRVVSSSAGDAAAAVEAVNSNNADTAATQVPTQPAQNTKRKSDVLEGGDEATPPSEVPKKIRRLDQSPAPTLVERDSAAKPADLPSQQTTATVAASPPAEASTPTEASVPLEHGKVVAPSASEAEVSSKTPLAQLAALAHGLTTESRRTMSGTALAESTSEPRRAPSIYPNTQTFDMRELMGDNYECPASPKSPTEHSRSESPDFSDDITPDDAHAIRSPPADDLLSDGDGVDHDEEDMAATFDKHSFTPPNSPPKFSMRAGYSVPDAVPEFQSQENVSEVASVNNSAGHDGSLEVNLNAPVLFERQNPVGSTSASSILSVAKAVVTNFFKQQSATPTPPPAPQSATVIPPVVHVPLPGTFNPFTIDLPELSPTSGVGVNPFLASPAKPLSPPAEESSQTLHQETQSTAFSSQATGASFFDSQPFMQRASYENPGYETDITESQFSQSQFGRSTLSGEVENERRDVDEVAAALAQRSPDVSIHVQHSPTRESANVPTVTEEPDPVNHRGPTAARDIAAESKGGPAPAKTLKHVHSVMSLSAKNKSDAQRVKAQQSVKRPGGLAKGAAAGKQEEVDPGKRERADETVPHLAQSTKSKADDDANKKRKLDAETKSKAKQGPNLKNSSSASQIGVPKQPTRPPLKPSFKPASSMMASGSGVPPKNTGGLPTKSSALPGTTRPTPHPYINPQAQIQAKMQATLDAQIAKEKAALMKAQTQQKLRSVEPEPEPVEEEEIELPDIASEYSNSDDEDRPSKIMADWAEPAELEKLLLRQQAEIDPDELFGEVGEPNLEAMFGPKNKFRVRSSSANWHNGDGLTAAETAEYARRMRE